MSIADRLRHNLSLKLASLIIAVVIWGVVHNQADPLLTRQETIAVEAAQVPPGLAVASIDPMRITATLYGRRSALERVGYAEAKLVADVRGAQIGTLSAKVEPHGLPSGVEIRYLSNRIVKITLDAVVSRSRSVVVQTRGEPAVGVTVTATRVRPAEATVSGPNTEVAQVARVVAPVDVTGRSESAPLAVTLVAVDAGGLPVSGVTIEPTQATVAVQMQQVNNRTVPVAPVVGHLPDGYEIASLSARPVVVTVTGEPAAMGALMALQTAPLDLASEPGRTQYVVPLQVPAGVKVLGTPSVQVTVTLRKAGAKPATPAAPPAPAQPAAKPAPAPPATEPAAPITPPAPPPAKDATPASPPRTTPPAPAQP